MRFNRNKKSLTLDLKQEKGKEIFSALLKKSDVIVENLRPGTVERLGFPYAAIREINPAVIYASICGFGKWEPIRGPYWERPGFDIVFQAMSGLMHNVGEKDGPPQFLGSALVDLYTPMVTAYGILLALRMREKTGLGQYLDTAMYDCAVALNEGAVAIHSYTGEIPGRDRPRIQAPLCAFKTKDGYVALMIPTEEIWARFCKAIGRDDLTKHPQLSSGPLRAKNYEALLQRFLDEWMAQRTKEEAIHILLQNGVPVGPSQTAKDLVNCPHLAARKMILDIEDPVGGKKKFVGSPVKLSEVHEVESRRAPFLGEHNQEILEGLLRMNPDQIEVLRAEKVIGVSFAECRLSDNQKNP